MSTNDQGNVTRAARKKPGENWVQADKRERLHAEELLLRLKSGDRILSPVETELVKKWWPAALEEIGRMGKLDEMSDRMVLKSEESDEPIGSFGVPAGMMLIPEGVGFAPQPGYRQESLLPEAQGEVWPGDTGSPDQVAVLVREPGQQSEQAVRVLAEVELAMALFVGKNRGYGDTGYVLGARGQYADINRKVGKLKHTLWDGNPAHGESIEEMLQDLIGHCGLALDYLRMEAEQA